MTESNYYEHDGELYSNYFPKSWAENHHPNTGPKDCERCAWYGKLNGVFIGYCVNCAACEYEFSRGHGFINPGVELELANVARARARETYLCNVDLDTVGDKTLFDRTNICYCTEEDTLSEVSEYNEQNESFDELNTAMIME